MKDYQSKVNFKSSLINFGSADFRRALVISLVLHALLLWQKLPAAGSQRAQAQPSRQAIFLNALLRNGVEPRALAATSPVDLARKRKDIPHRNNLTLPLRTTESRLAPQPVLEVAAPSGEGLDASGLRQYRLSLAVAARRFKLYPPQAMQNGWSGTAEVHLAVAANGVIQPAQLLRSSGFALLDAAAIEMVGNAAQQTAVPASLRGQSFSVPLPVVFDLND